MRVGRGGVGPFTEADEKLRRSRISHSWPACQFFPLFFLSSIPPNAVEFLAEPAHGDRVPIVDASGLGSVRVRSPRLVAAGIPDTGWSRPLLSLRWLVEVLASSSGRPAGDT